MTLFELLGDYTVRTVALGAALLGLVSGVLGSFAVLRRQSLLGDTLSHAALPGVCLGFIVAGAREIGSILAGALLTGVLAALLVLLLTRRSRLKTDAGLGIALSLFFAVGVVLLTYVQGTGDAAQGGLDSFLFGQAAALLRGDLWIMGGVTAAALALVAAFWKEFKLVSFDPGYAGSLGLPVVALEVTLTVMIALAVVVGLQMVGVVLMAAMVIAPAVAARQWVGTLGRMVALAAVIGVASGVVGAVLSATARGLATGPLIVLSVSAVVLVSLAIAPGRGLAWEAARRARDRRRLRRHQALASLLKAAGRPDPAGGRPGDLADDRRFLPVLAALYREGLVEELPRPEAEGRRYVLTPAGRAEAQRLAAAFAGEPA